jgi:FG-GAP repeat
MSSAVFSPPSTAAAVRFAKSSGLIPSKPWKSIPVIGPLVLMAAALFASGGASYQAPIDRTFTQIKKLTPSGGGKVGDFGCSVGFYGDTAIVGASMENIGSAEGQGSAYIFERNKGGSNKWRQVKKLTASDGAAEDYFGSSMAIYRDTVLSGLSRTRSEETKDKARPISSSVIREGLTSGDRSGSWPPLMALNFTGLATL